MINQNAVEDGSWKSTKLENKQWFVLFVCMTRRMKCIELMLLSCLIARAFHVIRVICYIACHYIGVNRPTTRDIASGLSPTGTTQQICQQYIDWWVNKVKIAMKLALPQLFEGTSRYNTNGSLKKKLLSLVEMMETETVPSVSIRTRRRWQLSRDWKMEE